MGKDRSICGMVSCQKAVEWIDTDTLDIWKPNHPDLYQSIAEPHMLRQTNCSIRRHHRPWFSIADT
eukprot:scaffold500152_cov43-Prasinocladus_malaysianus.AAC.1